MTLLHMRRLNLVSCGHHVCSSGEATASRARRSLNPRGCERPITVACVAFKLVAFRSCVFHITVALGCGSNSVTSIVVAMVASAALISIPNVRRVAKSRTARTRLSLVWHTDRAHCEQTERHARKSLQCTATRLLGLCEPSFTATRFLSIECGSIRDPWLVGETVKLEREGLKARGSKDLDPRRTLNTRKR
jgi:hypothetical protein